MDLQQPTAEVAAAPATLVGGSSSDHAGEASALMHGAWLMLVRMVWLIIAVLNVGLYFASVPDYAAQLHTLCTNAPCPSLQLTEGKLAALQGLGLSVDSYA